MSVTLPAKGGPALRRLPHQAGALASTSPAPRHLIPRYRPRDIKPLVASGLPTGIQLVGRIGDDARLMAAALFAERALAEAERRGAA